MPSNCTCGAPLSEDARFCHKCGKPQYDYVEPEPIFEPAPVAVVPPPVEHKPAVPVKFRLPVAIGISALAGIGIALFCAAVQQQILLYPLISLAGGAFAVTGYRALTQVRPTPKNGAIVGLMAGMVTMILFVLSIVVVAASFSSNGAVAQAIREETHKQGRGAELEKVLEQVRDPKFLTGFILGVGVLMFGTIALPSALGGFIGASMGKDQA